MATKPPPDLLDRDLAKARVREASDVAVPMLKEVVNQGAAVLARSIGAAKGGDEHVPIVHGFRQLLELIDGIAELVAEAAFFAARPLLRAAFEALLQVEYLLQEDTVRRAHNYLVADIRNRLKVYRSLDPATPSGEDLRRHVEQDERTSGVDFSPPDDLAERIDRFKRLLQKPGRWEEANQRFADAERQMNRVPPWFALDNGPRRINNLAVALGRGGQYRILYPDWSGTVHARDFLRTLTKSDKGGPAILGLRDPSHMPTTVSFAAQFATDAMQAMLRFYRPGEESSFDRWKLAEVTRPLRDLEQLYDRLGIGHRAL